MADVSTKKILIEVEARYETISQAMRRMSDLSVVAQSLKDMIKAEGKANSENAATLTDLKVQLQAVQKEYRGLNSLVAAQSASARVLSSALSETDSSLLSVQAQLSKATLAWRGLTAAERDSKAGQELKAQIDSLTKTLFDNETQLNRNKLTVGGYKGAIEGVLAKMSSEGKLVSATSQAYSDLLAKYQVAEANARELVLTTGAESEASVKAIAEVKQHGAALDALSAAISRKNEVTAKEISAYDRLMTDEKAAVVAAKEAYLTYGAESQQFLDAKAKADAFSTSLREVNAVMQGNTATAKAQTTAYQSLLANYQLAEANARELILTRGQEDAATVEAIAKVKQYGAELDHLNTTMGKYSAKTVNAQYATFSLSQVVREMPNFAIDARLGFMALSNNLPMLAQDFQMLKVQLGSTKLAFQAFAKSLLGVNTIMVLLSTVLIAWGPKMVDWVKGLFGATKSTEQFSSALANLRKNTEEGARIAEKNVAELDLLYGATQDVTRSMESRLEAARALQRNFPSYFKNLTDEQIITGQAGEAYRNLAQELLSVAVARKLADRYAENRVRMLELEQQNAESQRQILAKETDLARASAVENRYRKELEKQVADVGVFQSAKLGKLTKATKEARSRLETFTESVSKNNRELERLAKDNQLISESIDVSAITKNGTAGGGEGGGFDTARATQETDQFNDSLYRLFVTQKGLQNILSSEDYLPSGEVFAQRKAMAEQWLTNQTKIDEEATSDAIAAEKERNANTLKNDKLTKEELAKERIRHENELKRIDMEAKEAQMSRDQQYLDWKKKLLSEEQKYRADAIDQQTAKNIEAYNRAKADDIRAAGERYKAELELAGVNRRKQREAEAKHRSELAYINSAYDLLALQAQQKAVESQLQLANLSAEARKKLEEELGQIKIKIAEQTASATGKIDSTQGRESVNQVQADEEQKRSIRETLFQASAELIDDYYSYQSQKVEEQKSEELSALEEKHDKGLISDKTYENEKTKIEKAAFEQDKKNKIAQAWVEWALGLVRIWASPQNVASGGTLGIVESAALTATTLASTALINSKKYVAKRGMLIHGPSHAGGGVPVEAEGGESIINAKSTAKYRYLLSAINAAEGGVKFATGGIPVGLANDGGFSARQAFPVQVGPTADDIAKAVAKQPIFVSVEQIEKERGRYAKVKSRATI